MTQYRLRRQSMNKDANTIEIPEGSLCISMHPSWWRDKDITWLEPT